MRTSTGWMLAIAVLFAGCGTTTPKSGEVVVAPPTTALAVPVVLVASDAVVEARSGKEAFVALEKGKPLARVTAIRTTSSGAVLEIGAKKAKLWLKAHTSIDVGQEENGRVRVLLAEGEARLEEDASDVLLHRKGDSTLAAPTSKNIEAADWSLALETKTDTRGIGAIETRGQNGQKARLELRSLKVVANPAGDFAETTVEHVFYNDSEERLEGTFRFPLPDEALLVGLSMEIDGKMMDGELVEREKARKTFEKIVDEMQDPALLEWEQGSVFKLRVFPIEPKKEKRVVLRYVAPLHRGLDGLELLYPTSAS